MKRSPVASATRSAPARALTMIGLVLAGAAFACSSTNPDATVTPGELDRAGFESVVPVLNRRCGSLDCHGSRFRNLRIYGYGGIRLAASDNPEAPQTTPGEAALDYEAVMGLEPEVMRSFIASGRRDPSKLTFYRKARMLEAHEGGPRVAPGDSADRCLVSWLTSTVDGAACRLAAAERNPLDE